jgi:hypothetical protein
MLTISLSCLFHHASHPTRTSSTTRLKAVGMHLRSCILALAGISLVTAKFTRCGISEPTEDELDMDRRLKSYENYSWMIEKIPAKIDINVYDHCSHFACLETNITLG